MLDRNNAQGGLLDIRRNTFIRSMKKQRLAGNFSQVIFVVTSQRNKWFLSSVLFFGLGCALYFLLPARIAASEIGVGVILSGCAFWMTRRIAIVAFTLQLQTSLMAGFLTSAIHTDIGPQNILTKTLYATEITGTVINIEPRENRLRVTLEPSAITGLADGEYDWKVRLSFLGDSKFSIGDQVQVKARLFPLRPPAVPGDPDFARNLYFSGIGATGFAFGRQFQVLAEDKGYKNNELWGFIEEARQSISQTISHYLSAPEAGIAKALIIGERGQVTPDITEDLRKSGLAHLLAISGLHMGLLCGTVFFLFRFCLAAIPRIALRYPIKKWAAVAAALSGLIYLGLSGATVPTQRAFIMLLVVWIALLLDRRAISLRLVGVAAIVVLILRPDAVLGASFQLSFAAVGALVAFYDGPGRRWLDRQGMSPWYVRIVIYISGLLVTGIIVTAVTAPIIGFHFGRISMLGIVANLIAIPVMAFWVMPLIVATLILIPVGLGGVTLALMKPGLAVLIRTASIVADQEWGLWYVSGLSFIAVSCLLLALSWAMIWRDRAAIILGVPLLLIAVFAQWQHQSPNILVSGDRENWAVFDPDDGVLYIPDGLGEFQKSVWMSRFGMRREDEDRYVKTCETDPCLVGIGADSAKTNIIIASKLLNPFYACRNAEIVISLTTDLPRQSCQDAGAQHMIDDDVLWWQGGVALSAGSKDSDEISLQTMRATSGHWPWVIVAQKAGRAAR